MNTNNNKIENETLLSIYSAQWADLHHNRSQDWQLFKVEVIGMFGVGSLNIFEAYPEIQKMAAIVFAFLSFLSVCITLRHMMLNKEKMNTIKRIEAMLNAKDLYCHSSSSLIPFFRNWPKVQLLITATYCIFFFFFIWLYLNPNMVIPA